MSMKFYIASLMTSNDQKESCPSFNVSWEHLLRDNQSPRPLICEPRLDLLEQRSMTLVPDLASSPKKRHGVACFIKYPTSGLISNWFICVGERGLKLVEISLDCASDA